MPILRPEKWEPMGALSPLRSKGKRHAKSDDPYQAESL